MARVHGLHHITAIAGDPRRNLDFYTRVLGLRLVKKSVNQDAPDTYHLFYADGEGRPGTDITFFPWPAMAPFRRGTGHAVEVAFSVAPDSLAFWARRLESEGVPLGAAGERYGSAALSFEDPDGLALVLVETEAPLETTPWADGPVPAEHQLRGFHGVRLLVRSRERTARFLVDVMGLASESSEDGWHRYGSRPGAFVEVREEPDTPPGAWGTGGVHHVAFRVGDDGEQTEMREQVVKAGGAPTPVIDRFWFRSVYFKEPGGVLFELATVEPGFDVDEDPEHLGEALILPPWLEPQREAIEAGLVELPGPGTKDISLD